VVSIILAVFLQDFYGSCNVWRYLVILGSRSACDLQYSKVLFGRRNGPHLQSEYEYQSSYASWIHSTENLNVGRISVKLISRSRILIHITIGKVSEKLIRLPAWGYTLINTLKLKKKIFFNARLRRLAAASALEATSIQTFEISETCVWHLSRRWRAVLEALENWSAGVWQRS